MAKDYELAALEVDVKNVMHNLIAVHVAGDFWNQMIEWQKHFNVLVDAQTNATGSHQRVLNEAFAEIQKQQQELANAFGFAMMGLSLVTGPLISWVAGSIQNVWYPKFASTIKERAEKVKVMWGSGGPARTEVQIMTFTTTDHNKVAAKMYGDTGGQITELGINGAIRVVSPDFEVAKSAISQARSTPKLESFKTNLENAMLSQAQVTMSVILDVAETILLDPSWGAKCLERLTTKHPAGARVLTFFDKAYIAEQAYQMMCQDIDTLREKWANDWFFYGRNPPKIPLVDLIDALEVELWALWILEEQFSATSEKKRGGHVGGRNEPFEYYDVHIKGKTFGARGLPDAIGRKLVDMGVLDARTPSQIIAKGARQAEKERKRAAESTPRTEADRRARDARWKAEDEEERKERPAIGSVETLIGNLPLDAPHFFEALNAWAKNHPPGLSNGQLVSTKRVLEPIEVIHKSGKYKKKK